MESGQGAGYDCARGTVVGGVAVTEQLGRGVDRARERGEGFGFFCSFLGRVEVGIGVGCVRSLKCGRRREF